MKLDDGQLKELFALFSCRTKKERDQLYAEGSWRHFSKETLDEEYPLSQSKREHARDAWRAVMSFLRSRGYVLLAEGKALDLAFVDDEFAS